MRELTVTMLDKLDDISGGEVRELGYLWEITSYGGRTLNTTFQFDTPPHWTAAKVGGSSTKSVITHEMDNFLNKTNLNETNDE